MKNKSVFVAIFLVVYFFNRWVPAAQTYFNFVSPSFNLSNVDFNVYYQAGRAYLQGIEPYSASDENMPFVYPPTFIPLLGQLARFDYQTARTLWAAFYSLLFLGAAGYLFRSLRKEDRSTGMLILAGLVLYSYPLSYLIRQGQMDLVSSSISFFALLFYLNRRPNLSALCLAVATLVKLNPVMLLATYVLFIGDWKYLLRYGAALAALVLFFCLFISPDEYRIFATQVLPALTKSMGGTYNQTPLRFFAGNRYIPRLITLTLAGSLSLFAFWLGRKTHPKSRAHIFAFYLLNVIVMLLASGKAWLMAYTWFLLPVVPVLIYLLKGSPWQLVALSTAAFVAMQSIPYDGKYVDTVNMVGAVVAAGCMVWLLLRELRLPQTRSVPHPESLPGPAFPRL